MADGIFENVPEGMAQLTTADGSWAAMSDQWGQQCADFEEDFGGYALDALPVLRDLAAKPTPAAGVFALRRGGQEFEALCQANSTFLPGYTGKVLRVRHMLLAPRFDFGEYPIEDYVSVLSAMFARSVYLAKSALPSDHIKFHLRSPADRQFFEAGLGIIQEHSEFDSVKIRGAWLYMTWNRAAQSAPQEV